MSEHLWLPADLPCVHQNGKSSLTAMRRWDDLIPLSYQEDERNKLLPFIHAADRRERMCERDAGMPG